LFIRTATVTDGGVAEGSVYDKASIERLLTAMQQAELTRDAEIMRDEAPVLRVDIRYTEQERGYQMRCDYQPVYACDTEVLALIKELTGVEPVTLTSEHVKTIQIERNMYIDVQTDAFDYDAYYEKYGEVITEAAASTREVIDRNDSILIDDPAVIDQLLQNGVPAGMRNAAAEWFETDEMMAEDGLTSVSYNVAVKLQNDWNNLRYTAGNAPLELIESLFE
ncbi:MAG: hypothetical protein IKM54_04130, partial [Butyricicoccus sp.]|nr:hypothetical protein [Butyricicoccus sp.]